MTGNTIKFGNKKLQRAIKKYGSNVLDEVRKIVVDTAYLIHSNAQALAPVDDSNLRDSIEVELLEGGLLAIVRVTANYAIYVNFGTGIYAKEGNGRQTPWTYWSDKLNRFVTTQGQRPQEFWGPAIDIGERHFKKEMRKLGQ